MVFQFFQLVIIQINVQRQSISCPILHQSASIWQPYIFAHFCPILNFSVILNWSVVEFHLIYLKLFIMSWELRISPWLWSILTGQQFGLFFCRRKISFTSCHLFLPPSNAQHDIDNWALFSISELDVTTPRNRHDLKKTENAQ